MKINECTLWHNLETAATRERGWRGQGGGGGWRKVPSQTKKATCAEFLFVFQLQLPWKPAGRRLLLPFRVAPPPATPLAYCYKQENYYFSKKVVSLSLLPPSTATTFSFLFKEHFFAAARAALSNP